MTICYSENTTECVGSSDQTCDGQEKKVVFYFESIGLIDDDDFGGGLGLGYFCLFPCQG